MLLSNQGLTPLALVFFSGGFLFYHPLCWEAVSRWYGTCELAVRSWRRKIFCAPDSRNSLRVTWCAMGRKWRHLPCVLNNITWSQCLAKLKQFSIRKFCALDTVVSSWSLNSSWFQDLKILKILNKLKLRRYVLNGPNDHWLWPVLHRFGLIFVNSIRILYLCHSCRHDRARKVAFPTSLCLSLMVVDGPWKIFTSENVCHLCRCLWYCTHSELCLSWL